MPPLHSQFYKPLQGYRLGFLLQYLDEEMESHCRDYGASILNIYSAPETEEEFKQWWKAQVENANRDGVILVVVKSRCTISSIWLNTPQKRFLSQIEEEEWYNDENGPSRVRVTRFYKVMKVILGQSETLTDDWGDSIEKGDAADATKTIPLA
mmetsp:Transcript_35368/g.74677  ORF Transcript_35368/g.74677 Transcript_35368/m.74677 type:complete len:153 (-) Transcript_35368:168-626(-)